MNADEIEKQIREHWFDKHRATLAKHGDLTVLNWKETGTRTYYVRYVFDSGRMYVTGDTGEAVFCFTELADVHNVSVYDIEYFERKLTAYSGSRRDFDNVKAAKRLREWLNTLKENGKEYDHDDMRELFEHVRGCSSVESWAYVVNTTDFIGELDCDYWDWIYNIGDEIPWRIHGYLVGLKMASEQLRKEQTQ